MQFILEIKSKAKWLQKENIFKFLIAKDYDFLGAGPSINDVSSKGEKVELVSKELNHLAAILHIYARVFDFYEVFFFFQLLFFKKKREILLHFYSEKSSKRGK